MSNDPVIYEYESSHQTRLSVLTQTLALLRAVGPLGMTSRDLGKAMYGDDTSGKSRAGSPLTRLSQEGRIVALMEKREGHHVYVMPEHLEGRAVWPGYRHKGGPAEVVVIEVHCEPCTCDKGEDLDPGW